MDPLLEHVAAWKPFSALVVGDFMLDEYLYGNAERLSPDAPVPILHVTRRDRRAGGSANVCLDLAALDATVHALGVVGDDEPAHALRQSLTAGGVRADALITDASRPTTVKQNLIGLAQGRHSQKMFRVDFESRGELSPQLIATLLARADELLSKVDIVCLEDYAKGVCCEALCQGLIERATKLNKPVFVDPANITNYRKYRGCTAITPNRTEAENASGLTTHAGASVEENAAIARRLQETLHAQAIVLTLDKHGALLYQEGQPPLAVPTIARQVYDVTGAGDMFLAGLAAARANNIDWEPSVRFANAAAGLEVEVFGVEPIPLQRIHHALLIQSSHLPGKSRTKEQLLIELAARRREGKRIVFTNGCFDVLHSGHVSILEKAAAEGDFLVVGLNDDASVRRLKGPSRPVNNQDDRARVLGALQSVGAVILFPEDTPLDLIKSIKPDVLVKGADYTKDKVVGADIVESYGGRIALIDLVQGKSTTNTIAKMQR